MFNTVFQDIANSLRHPKEVAGKADVELAFGLVAYLSLLHQRIERQKAMLHQGLAADGLTFHRNGAAVYCTRKEKAVTEISRSFFVCVSGVKIFFGTFVFIRQILFVLVYFTKL